MIGISRSSTIQATPVLTLLLAAAACGGCGNWWWTSFLDPSQVSGDFRRPMISEIQRSLSFEDTPPGIPGAEEPTAEDLVAIAQEYRLEPNDVVGIRIPQFVEYEPVSDLTLTVNEVGDVQVPQLGWIHIEGMTAREVEAEVRDQMVQRRLFKEGNTPPIQVVFPRQRQQFFNIFGGVTAADTYRILETDFRLLDALSLAGGLPEQVEWIYVYRSQSRPTRTKKPVSMPSSAPEQRVAPQAVPEAPPVAPVTISDMGTPGPKRTLVQASPTAPATTSAPDGERELIDVIAPTTTRGQSAPSTAVARPASEPQPTPSMPKFIYLNGQWVEVGQKPSASQAALPAQAPKAIEKVEKAVVASPSSAAQPAPVPAAPSVTQPATTEPVTWESVAGETRQRIIRISAAALRRGDARYNIVIRHRDVIRVDPGPLGEFFLLGQVQRPGVYSLTGRDITLKQAVAAGGGLALLAWPSRCEITRRLDQDREQIIPVNLEQIFAGNQPDVFLRPNDIVNVGTNIVAPFLATIRTSFRMSYGFGFVYDRNFGDIDSFNPQINPNDRRRSELQQRFPGLFP